MTTLARSMIVRATVVTGMPRCGRDLRGVSVGLRWSLTPLGAWRPPRPGTVTWIAESARRRSRAAAAVVWLSAAVGPQREGCGHPATLEREDSVADGVDASVDDVEPSRTRRRRCIAAGGQPRL